LLKKIFIEYKRRVSLIYKSMLPLYAIRTCINENIIAIDKHLQNDRNCGQKLPVAGKLFAIVHLFPPSQCVIHPLVISKWSSLLPVEKVVRDLKEIFGEASNRNGK
jgi:hypothetical protein